MVLNDLFRQPVTQNYIGKCHMFIEVLNAFCSLDILLKLVEICNWIYMLNILETVNIWEE